MRIGPQRPVNPDAIVAPQGYRVEALVTGLSLPSAVSFGPGGELYLAESGGVAGRAATPPRVLRIDPDRSVNEIGRLDHPIMGLVYRNGELFIGEDGPAPRILRVTADAEIQILVEGLPGGGDYGLSGMSLDGQGRLLFGLGTRTNSGVVGPDNVARGWVARMPDAADVSGTDVDLAGVNYVTTQSSPGGLLRSVTGGMRPFGQRSEPGESVRGSARCGGAVYRLTLDAERPAGEPERLAWGLRNPIGVISGPEGRIFATEGGMEERGSRPVAAAPDNLWEVQAGGYYGWPDHASGISVTDPRFRLPGHPIPRRLLSKSPQVTTVPLATFAARSGVGRLDFSVSEAFGFVGQALVALSGDWTVPAFPGDPAPSAGHRIVRVDPRTGETVDFLVNRTGAPSSVGNSGGLERPYDIRFDPSGEVLYIVDLGEVQLSREFGLSPYGGTGVVWRVTRVRPMTQVPDLRSAAGADLASSGEEGEEGEETGDLQEGADEESSDEEVAETEAEPAGGATEGGDPVEAEEPASEAALDDGESAGETTSAEAESADAVAESESSDEAALVDAERGAAAEAAPEPDADSTEEPPSRGIMEETDSGVESASSGMEPEQAPEPEARSDAPPSEADQAENPAASPSRPVTVSEDSEASEAAQESQPSEPEGPGTTSAETSAPAPASETGTTGETI